MVTELTESDIPSPKSPSKRTPTDSKKTLTRLDSITDQPSPPAGDLTPKQDAPSSTEKDVASPNNSKETDPPVEENKVRNMPSCLPR